MHRAAAVRRRDSGDANEKLKGGPIDFLARLEALEKAEAPAASSEPALPHMGGGIRPFRSMAGKARPSIAGAEMRGSTGEDADLVLNQLKQMEQQIDELRTRKRERTPPEKHAGAPVTSSAAL